PRADLEPAVAGLGDLAGLFVGFGEERLVELTLLPRARHEVDRAEGEREGQHHPRRRRADEAEVVAHSRLVTRRYPRPRTVSIIQAQPSSFSRIRRMWTSMTFEPVSKRVPQTCSSSCERVTTRPALWTR